MKEDRRNEEGFLTLDGLVGIVLLGLLGILLEQGLHFGVQASGHVSALRFHQGGLETADLTLRRLISSADPARAPAAIAMRGSPLFMAFTTDMPLHGTGELRRADVTIYKQSSDLILRWKPRPHVTPFTPPALPQETILADKVDSVSFDFQTRAGLWTDHWKGEGLPALVRIRLKFEEGSGRLWPPILVVPSREAWR